MNKYYGLNQTEVEQRVAAGLTNYVEKEKPKSSLKIFAQQCFTLFNLYLVIIAIALISIQEYLSIFFLNIMVMNAFIQSFQIIRSVKTVHELNVLIAQTTKVMRDGELVELMNDDLVMDDIVYIHTGCQIAADCVFLDDLIEMNESMITGESRAVEKRTDDFIYSGSFVSSGGGYAKVVEVGANNYIQKIMTEARKYKEVRSELMDTFNGVASFCAKIVGPIGLILAGQAIFIRHQSIPNTIVTISTVLLGLLPQGLVLLTSISFAVSVFRLGRKQTLVQSTYAIETLSNVDVICIDKTGTLTSGLMKVADIIPQEDGAFVNTVLSNYLYHSMDTDSTTKALKSFCEMTSTDTLVQKLAFSSQRKWGAMRFESMGDVYLGAPDFLIPGLEMPKSVTFEQDLGARILLLAKSHSNEHELNTPLDLEVLAYVIIEDSLREDAPETMAFFNENDVVVKVISGDHINTLLAVASNAGIQQGHKAIDVSQLESDEELEDAVMNYNVIGRASPYQKQTMVKMLQKNGNKVAMVGDGVNDVLALRSADCSIAMGAGSPAAIQIAEVVLLDNEFATMVDVVMEGRAVTNNITRSASMYYLATLFIFILSLISIGTNTAFPFIPIQMSVMSMFVEGMPSTLVTFEASYTKPNEPVLKQVFRNILPLGLSLITSYALLFSFTLGGAQRQTMLYYMVIFLSYMLVVKIFKQLTPLRLGVLVLSSTILILICRWFASYLYLVPLSSNETVIIFAMVGFIYILWRLIDWVFSAIVFPQPRR